MYRRRSRVRRSISRRPKRRLRLMRSVRSSIGRRF